MKRFTLLFTVTAIMLLLLTAKKEAVTQQEAKHSHSEMCHKMTATEEVCHICDGKGLIHCGRCTDGYSNWAEKILCTYCNGTDLVKCWKCYGTGKL